MCDCAWWVHVFAWVGAACVASTLVFLLAVLVVAIRDSLRWSRTVGRMSKEWREAHRENWSDHSRGSS